MNNQPNSQLLHEFNGKITDVSLSTGPHGLELYGILDSQRCKNCPVPTSPFAPMLCMSCADKYCLTYPMGCGQSCQGCRARVMTVGNNDGHPSYKLRQKYHGYQQYSKNPETPHTRCGQVHPIGTQCPSHSHTVGMYKVKVPSVPHTKCGQFHAIGTPCPIMMVSVPSEKPKHPSLPHTKCGQFHAVGTPCPGMVVAVSEKPKHPSHPHTKCGQFHPVGTPCPGAIASEKPKHPHSKCGHIHPVGTPCPMLANVVQLVEVHALPKPHSACGRIHAKGTPCPE